MKNIAAKSTKGNTNAKPVQRRTLPEYLPMDVYINPGMMKAPSTSVLMLLTLTRSYLATGGVCRRSAA